MKSMKPTWRRCIPAWKTRIAFATALACSVPAANAAPLASPWLQPAASLASRIADLLGPGEARFSFRNLSSISPDQIPAIRKLLEQDLKARDVTPGGPDSANSIRITFSENARERLWVAEIAEGNDTRIAMVALPSAPADPPKPAGELLLRRQALLSASEPILALLERPSQLLLLEPGQVVSVSQTTNGWQEQQRVSFELLHPIGRDPRGTLLGDAAGPDFSAWLPGVRCSGTASSSADTPFSIQCHESDDPWPVLQASSTPVRAFYNAARNYFTGVLLPNPGPDLPPFYSLALLPRSAGTAALLLGGISGKVQMADHGALYSVAGTRDWGSDFAVLQSGCGAGTQVIVSGSGDAATDSLRAYELPGYEAVPASQPLEIPGAILSLSTAPDQRSVLAVVRTAASQYEVDRVTALCN